MSWLVIVAACVGFFCLGCAVSLTFTDLRASGRRGGEIDLTGIETGDRW